MEINPEYEVWIKSELRTPDYAGQAEIFALTILVIYQRLHMSQLIYKFACGDRNVGFNSLVPWEDRNKIRDLVFTCRGASHE